MGASSTEPRSRAPEQVISRETRIGRTDSAGRHRLAVASNTDKGRAWYIPTARVTTPQLVSRPANRQTRATCGPGSCAAVLTLTGAAPGTYPRPQSRYLCTCHGKPNLKLHPLSTRATCGPGAGAAGLTLTGAVPGTYPRPRSTHIGRAHTRRGQCLVHTHGPSHEQSDAYSKHDPEPDRPTGCGPVKW